MDAKDVKPGEYVVEVVSVLSGLALGSCGPRATDHLRIWSASPHSSAPPSPR